MRHYRQAEIAPTSVDVFDTPSGLGGTFTVSIIEDRGDTCVVRVWYGRASEMGWVPWHDWDGYRFTVPRSKLSRPRRMALMVRSQSHYG